MQRRLSNRLGPGFYVERIAVRGVPGKQDWRTYTAYIELSRSPALPHPVWRMNLNIKVQAEGRTCPYDVLVIKARMLAELS
jgi:hypothetical protein